MLPQPSAPVLAGASAVNSNPIAKIVPPSKIGKSSNTSTCQIPLASRPSNALKNGPNTPGLFNGNNGPPF